MEILIVLILCGIGYYFYKKNKKSNSLPMAKEWVKDFIIYHMAKEFQWVQRNELPEIITQITNGSISSNQEFGLLGAIQNYAQFRKITNVAEGDLIAGLAFANTFLRMQLELNNSTNALHRFIRKMHKTDTGQEMTVTEQKAQFNEIRAQMNEDDKIAIGVRNMLLRNSVEEEFERRHSKNITAYIQEMVENNL